MSVFDARAEMTQMRVFFCFIKWEGESTKNPMIQSMKVDTISNISDFNIDALVIWQFIGCYGLNMSIFNFTHFQIDDYTK
jgi:hypothetical protein